MMFVAVADLTHPPLSGVSAIVIEHRYVSAMKKRRKLWIIIGLVMFVFASLLIPGSPVNITDSWNAGKHADRSVSEWVADLNHHDSQARITAIKEVGNIGPDAAAGVPQLAKILAEDPNTIARSQAALSLSKMGEASTGALEELAAALNDPDPLVRFNSVRTLHNLGALANPVIPKLMEALNDDSNHTTARTFHHTVHQSILRALGPVSAGSSEALPVLVSHLDAAQPIQTRISSILALRDLGEPARASAPTLRLLIKDPDPDIRFLAEDTLKSLGESLDGETAQTDEKFELPEDDRRYLWKIESAGNLLVKHGFAPLASALKTADRAALAKILSPDFIGGVIDQPKVIQSKSETLDVERLDDSGMLVKRLNSDEFLDRLMTFRQLFKEKAPGVKFNMMTLSPETYGDLDSKIWKGMVQLRLDGESTKGAPAEIVAVIRYEIIKPTESDLQKSGWLKRAEIIQVLSAQSRKPLFADVTKARGLKTDRLIDNWNGGRYIPTTGGAYVSDYDQDGWLDLLVTDISGITLYRGQPNGKFTDVTKAVGLTDKAEDVVAVWVDLDGDGWDDLIVSRHVYRNDHGKRFEDVTAKCNIRPPDHFANIVVADYDRDGKLDLYFARPGAPGGNSWLDHRSSDPNGNYLFRNLGNFQFEDVTRKANAAGGRRSTFTAAWLDANNDGWPDLYVPNEFGDGVLLVNDQNGSFKETPLASKPADFGTMGLAVGDVNNDGFIDIFSNDMYSKAGTRVIGNMNPKAYPPHVMEQLRRFVTGSQLHLNKGNLKFEQVGSEKKVAAVGWAYGAALADLDNDGFLDIYATAGYVSRDRNEPDG